PHPESRANPRPRARTRPRLLRSLPLRPPAREPPSVPPLRTLMMTNRPSPPRLTSPLSPSLLPLLRLRARCGCVVDCRVWPAEIPGRRRGTLLPGSRPRERLRLRWPPWLLQAARVSNSPLPTRLTLQRFRQTPRLSRLTLRPNRPTLRPMPQLLRQSLQEPALPGPRSLRADRALANSPMSRCVADFRAPRGETPGHRKASHRRVRPNLQQARPNRQPARPSRQQMRPR